MTLLSLLTSLLTLCGLFFTLIGLLTFYHWLKIPDYPSDDSNRINNITSWWIGLTRPEVIAHCHKFFRQDCMENIRCVDNVCDCGKNSYSKSLEEKIKREEEEWKIKNRV